MFDLKTQIAALTKDAGDILAKAAAENRTPTDEEFTLVDAKTAEAETLQKAYEHGIKSQATIDSLASSKSDEDAPAATATKSFTPGEHFLKNVDFDALGAGAPGLKAPAYKAATDSNTTAGLTSITHTEKVTDLVRRKLTVLSVLPSEEIDTQAISYLEEQAEEGAAGTTAEDGTKNAIKFNFVERIDYLKKVTAYTTFTKEMAKFKSYVLNRINKNLAWAVLRAKEDQILNGDGTGNNIRGLLNRSGIQTEVSANKEDNDKAIFRATTKVANVEQYADVLFLNPLDWQNLRLAQDENGQYYSGGAFTGAYGNGDYDADPKVWSLTPVVTPAIAAGTFLVGDSSTVTVFTSGGLEMESSNSHADNLIKNRVTVVAEEFTGLQNLKPAAWVKGTFSNVAAA